MAFWVIDTDGGVDDAQALILALSDRSFPVVAITTVAGNVGLDQATINIAECVRICDRQEVPIYKGAARPMVSAFKPADEHIHGDDGLGGYWEHHQPTDLPEPLPGTAALEIIRLANEHPGQLNLVTIGPLTNLGIALCLDEGLAGKLGRVVVMGGAPTGNGNVTVAAEFNIWSDPEAAHIAFERLPKIELVTWELCIDPKHIFPTDWKALYFGQSTRKGEFIRAISERTQGVEFCDPIALIVAMHPEVIQESSLKEGWVELAGTLTRGMTLINWGGSDLVTVRTSTHKQLQIITTVDMQETKRLLLESVSS